MVFCSLKSILIAKQNSKLFKKEKNVFVELPWWNDRCGFGWPSITRSEFDVVDDHWTETSWVHVSIGGIAQTQSMPSIFSSRSPTFKDLSPNLHLPASGFGDGAGMTTSFSEAELLYGIKMWTWQNIYKKNCFSVLNLRHLYWYAQQVPSLKMGAQPSSSWSKPFTA